MSSVIIGILAVAIGVFLCLRGQSALRVVLALWGALVGFTAGARALDRWTDIGYLDGPVSWAAAIGCALVFAALAYLYFAVGVVLAMAAMGFVLGGTAAVALGVESSTALLVIGLIAGIGLAALAIAGNLPALILIVISSLAGASLIVGGVLLITDEVRTSGLDAAFAEQAPSWTTPAVLVIAAVGVALQLLHGRSSAKLDRS